MSLLILFVYFDTIEKEGGEKEGDMATLQLTEHEQRLAIECSQSSSTQLSVFPPPFSPAPSILVLLLQSRTAVLF